MGPFAKSARWAVALLLVASAAGCTVEPVASPSASSPSSPVGTPAPPAAPPATTPTVVRAKLPTETMPVRVLAISGEHVLVQGELGVGQSTYRISHDAGRTWAETPFPCANPDGCSVVPPGGDRIGRAVGGVVVGFSHQVNRLNAFSLIDGAEVGTAYTLAAADSVYDLAGGRALLMDSVTGEFTVHSLLDGTDHVLAAPGGSAYRLLDDGSVLTSDSGSGTTWIRIAPDGSTTPVLGTTRGTGDVLITGEVAWFLIGGGGGKPPRICAVNIAAGVTSCQHGVTTWDRVYGVGSTGAVIQGYVRGTVTLSWLGYADGRVAKPVKLELAKVWDPGWPYSAENAAPLVSNRATAATTLVRPQGTGVTTLELDWATRPVLPSQLALGSDTLLGSGRTHSSRLSWTRSLSATQLGTQRRLGDDGDIAASGSRWTLFTGGTIRLYAGGRPVGSFDAPMEGSSLTFAGKYLFARPWCRTKPLQTDEDCDPSEMLYSSTGKRLAIPAATEDAHGDLLVSRGGDGRVSSPTFIVTDFRDTGVAPITVNLPDPGTDGYYADVRLVGDWIGATQHLADGSVHPVLANFRTSRILVGTENARFLALGDGIAVSVLARATTLQVWEFATGATQTLAASSTVVAVDGRRLAYTTGSEVAVADFGG